jgi:hypothetical protein
MKLQFPFVQLPLKFDAAFLLAEIESLGESVWRPHPQGFPGNSALTLVTTNGDPDNDDLGGKMLPTPHLLRCPYLMQVLASIGATWGRTRLMRLSGQAEVTPHIDTGYYWRERVRVHVPILTQPGVRFSCGDAEINMAAGECWIFDTWRLHRVINDGDKPRIHLVADTVGGEGFWDLLQNGRASGQVKPDWQPRRVAPRDGPLPQLDYEAHNVPVVMTPWELREHIVFVLGEAEPHPKLPLAHQFLVKLSRQWHALWARYGEDAAGWPRYAKLLDTASAELRAHCASIVMKNDAAFISVIEALVLEVALSDRKARADDDLRQMPRARSTG